MGGCGWLWERGPWSVSDRASWRERNGRFACRIGAEEFGMFILGDENMWHDSDSMKPVGKWQF